jgi:carboxyl-terminal processing protease
MKIVPVTSILLCLCIQYWNRANESAIMSEADKRLAVQSFQYIWETVRDKHYDPLLGGLDWQGVYDRYLPIVLNAETKQEVTRTLVKMLDTLELSHFNIIPGYFYHDSKLWESKNYSWGTIGCEIRVVEEKAFIFRVHKGSPIHDAGLSYGNEIIAINDLDVPSDLQILRKELSTHRYCDLILSNRVNILLQGKAGDSISIVYRNHHSDTCRIHLHFIEPAGELFQLGFFPPDRIWIETDTISSGIGYITFNAFMDPQNIMTKFNSAMKNFMNFMGIIIDLRGNPGGLLNMVQGMAGWFIAEKNVNLGSMCYRDMSLNIPVYPRPQTFQGKVAVLIDELSGCASEILAAGLWDGGRARLFGCSTAGAVLGSSVEILPNGDGFQYALACYRTSRGKILEGEGLKPDVEISLTPAVMQAETDPVIRAAVRWIEDEDNN